MAIASILLAAGATALVMARVLGAPGSGEPAAAETSLAPRLLEVRIGSGRRSIDLGPGIRAAAIDEALLRRLLAERVPSRWQVTDGRARLTYSLDRSAVVRAIRRAPTGIVTIRARPVASTIAAPVVAQRLRNNCESAALEILMATVGRRVPQLTLQAAFPVSGTPDPIGDGASRVWGDPEEGYVGRPEGGGVAGGFGVFQGPVVAVAGRFGVALQDLSGGSVREIVRTVRGGRAVMVWIGLSDGPYGEWTSPAGRRVRVNFGEHTVVINGITEDGRLLVVNPLEGTREVWTRDRFTAMWDLLDRRAVVTIGPRVASS
ncbi:MAG: C39 family peptidase [Thermoleophilia bacterium]